MLNEKCHDCNGCEYFRKIDADVLTYLVSTYPESKDVVTITIPICIRITPILAIKKCDCFEATKERKKLTGHIYKNETTIDKDKTTIDKDKTTIDKDKIITYKIKDLFINAFISQESHHKQYHLINIAKELGILEEIRKQIDEEGCDFESGISP